MLSDIYHIWKSRQVSSHGQACVFLHEVLIFIHRLLLRDLPLKYNDEEKLGDETNTGS